MAPNNIVRTRFAPSPTGALHIGGVRTALFSWLFARHTGGQFLLRIEDTDRERSTPESVEQIKITLRAYGLDWDEGPEVGGSCGPYTQSERLPIYRAHADKLLSQGHLYKCWCTKHRLEELNKERMAARQTPGYDRHCRFLCDEQKSELEASGAPYVLRLAVPTDGETECSDIVRGITMIKNSTLSDQVMFKSDGYPTYHLASIVDDHEMGITHVLRGEEWISSTPIHVLLYKASGWEPPLFGHLASVMKIDKDGKKSKLSKRDGDGSAMGYFDKGYLPSAVLNLLLLTGWGSSDTTEILSSAERIERFDLSGLVASAAVLNISKLNHFNGEYLKKLPLEDFVQWMLPHLVFDRFVSDPVTTEQVELVRLFAPMLQTRVSLWDEEARDYVRPYFQAPAQVKEKLLVKGCSDDKVREALSSARDVLATAESYDASVLEASLTELTTRLDLKKKLLLAIVRMALMGCDVSMPMFHSFSILGRTETLARLDAALATLADPIS